MNNANQELCLRLLRAESEEEVVDILQSCGFWDNRDVWVAYGGIQNNRGIVGNQQSSPVAALVEKIVNSIDAVLIAECLRSNIDPSSKSAPPTMRAAVEKFFNIRDGRLQNMDASTRTMYAEHIRLVACGTKEQPAYMIVDRGEGQAPDDFPETFLSLLRENKTAIRFVQGKFNMGGTGVLQFAGTHGFQLLISKRQPNLPCKSDSRRDQWGFSLIRRLDPGPSQPQTMYVYLAPDKKIPSFTSDTLPLLPGPYPSAYEGELEAGTCLKIWNYKLPGRLKSLVTLDLRYALERHLQEPALPIRLHERRLGYQAHSYDTTMSGLSAVFADGRDRIEQGLDTGGPIEVQRVGSIQVRVVVIKEEVEKKKTRSDRFAGGVFFNVNGQMHSQLGSEFIGRRTKFDYIAKDTIVLVDCTELPQRIREDLFLASRDRMRQCQERTLIEDAIVDYLKDHQGLRELNARRRQARLQERTEEDTSEVMKSLLRADPTLAEIFGRGKRIKVPVGPLPEEKPYVGKRFPTFFRIAKEPKGGLVKGCPINRKCRIEFETDAENDYFSRSIDPGRIEVRGTPTRVGAVHLWNGRAQLRFAPPIGSNEGDRLRITVIVSDISRVQPFESEFSMNIEPEAPPAPSGAPPTPPGAAFTNFPNIIEVRQESWATHGFNELSAVELKFGENETIDMYINMDNLHLKNEIARRRSVDTELLQYWFKYGLCLLTLGMLYQHRQSIMTSDDVDNEHDNKPSDTVDIFGQIASASRGLAVTIIPSLAHLGKGKIDT